MTTTITDGLTTVTPDLVDGYTATRASRNVVRAVLGLATDAVSLRPAGLRRGRLVLLFADETDAFAASDLLAADDEFTLASSERPSIDMTFVVDGDIEVELDDDTRDVWLVSFDYQETD